MDCCIGCAVCNGEFGTSKASCGVVDNVIPVEVTTFGGTPIPEL